MISVNLIQRAKAGEREALEELLQELESFVYRMAYAQVKKKQDAEDIAQETLIRVCRSIHTFQEHANVRTWVARILLNYCHDWRKKRREKLEHKEEFSFEDFIVDEESQVMDNLEKWELNEAIAQLPKQTQHILFLRFYGLKYKDIAAKLNLPINTVSSEINRATAKLRLQLQIN